MSLVSVPPFYGCSVLGGGVQTGSCCNSLPANLNITSGATVCQTTSSDATKTLQTCLEAVSGNSNNTVNCNFSGKASGGRKGATLVGSVALAGMVAMTVLATMA